MPNIGKSTLFNCLSMQNVPAENFVRSLYVSPCIYCCFLIQIPSYCIDYFWLLVLTYISTYLFHVASYLCPSSLYLPPFPSPFPSSFPSPFLTPFPPPSPPSLPQPFCTIDPNNAVVEVPDSRIEFLKSKVKPQSVTPALLSITDIAGLGNIII